MKKQADYKNLELVYKDLSVQRSHRLRQILRATQVALLLIAIVTTIQGHYADTQVLVCTGLLLFSVDWALARHKFALGSWILLSSLTIMLTYLAWVGFGLYDSAMLGYCGVLIFSALLGHKRLLI